MNWIKKHKADIILFFFSVVAMVIIVDFLLHFTNFRSAIKKSYYPRYYFTADTETGFDIAPSFATTTHIFPDGAYPIWSNSMGCFDREYENERPYIYLAGDSFTWGFSPFEDKWGTKIEVFLGMRVIKCGVGGHGTKQEFLKTVRNIGKFSDSPELIIVGYTQGNDIEDDANFPNGTVWSGYLVPYLAKNGVTEDEAKIKYARFDTYCTVEVPANPFLQRVRCWFNDHSIIYNLVKNNVRKHLLSFLPEPLLKKAGLVVEEKKQTAAVDAYSEKGFETHLQNVLKFKELAEEKNSKLLFVLVPGDNEKLKLFLEKEEITYLDLRPVFEKYRAQNPLQWKVDGHWNILGNHLAGFVVSKFIIENNLIPVQDKEEKIKEINTQFEREFGGV